MQELNRLEKYQNNSNRKHHSTVKIVKVIVFGSKLFGCERITDKKPDRKKLKLL